MKIEVDLLRMNNEGCAVKAARTCAVALLSALPDDQAELAVVEWEAVRTARAGDANAQREALAAEPPRDTIKEAIDKSKEDALLMRARPRPRGTRIIAPNDPEPLAEEAAHPSEWHALADELAAGATHRAAAPSGPESNTPLADCLSAKTANALTRVGYQTLGDLAGRSGKFLRSTVDRFGKGAQTELEAAMAAAGLAFAPDKPAKRGRRPVQQEHEHPLHYDASGASQQEREPIPQTALGRPAAPPQDVGYAEAPTSGNGASEPPMSLRELCRQAEAQVGREKVWEVFQKHGVTRLSEVKDETAFRADVAALG